MPQRRTLLAIDGQRRIEHVVARPHGEWSVVHRTSDHRWVMPGSGSLEWRTPRSLTVIDELTAFRVAPAEAYQLRHEGERCYVVLSSDEPAATRAGSSAWIVTPAELLRWRIALRRLRAGAAPSDVLAAMRRVLAVSRALGSNTQPESLLRARRFLIREAAARHSLAEIGEASHASAFHLERLARRHLGLSLHQYRLQLRMAAAIARIEAGDRDIAGLAHDLGFSSQSHFGAVFRRETGVTPGRARRLLAC